MDICAMLMYTDCSFFIFFTPEYDGEMKNVCVLFKERFNDKIHMKGVISGAGEENYIVFDPGYGGYGGYEYGGYGGYYGEHGSYYAGGYMYEPPMWDPAYRK